MTKEWYWFWEYYSARDKHYYHEEELSVEQVDETCIENEGTWYIIKEIFNEDEEKLFERLVTLMGCIAGNEIPPMRNVTLMLCLKR